MLFRNISYIQVGKETVKLGSRELEIEFFTYIFLTEIPPELIVSQS